MITFWHLLFTSLFLMKVIISFIIIILFNAVLGMHCDVYKSSYHSWIYSLYQSPLYPFPHSWNSFNRSLFKIFVRSLAFLGKKDLRLHLKNRPADLLPLVSPCLIVSRLAKQLRNFQLLNYPGMSTCSIWWLQIIRDQRLSPSPMAWPLL
jgi:hypothetical protein